MSLQRFVTGVSLAVSRSHVGYELAKDNYVDFGVLAKCVGTVNDPDGSTNKDERRFTILSVEDTFCLPDVDVTVAKNCAVKVDELVVGFSRLSFIGLGMNVFSGFVVYIELCSGDSGGRTTLFTKVLNMEVSLESPLVIRDIPSFEAVSGSEFYVFVKVYSLNSSVSGDAHCIGDLTVTGSYHYSLAE